MTAQPVEDVTVRDNPAVQRFEVWVGDERVGLSWYEPRGGDVYAFVHTEVEPRFEGRGLAARLVGEALTTAAERGWSVLPHCPYVRRYVGTHREHAALVPPDRRPEFGL